MDLEYKTQDVQLYNHVESNSILQMDHQYILVSKHILDYDFLLYMLPQFHKYLDMDLDISGLYRLCQMNIHYLQHILVYNLVGLQCTQRGMNKLLDH